jgi:aerobic-type carbon monoxide dehydrogenase small subunit (CoxS/CutS family)
MILRTRINGEPVEADVEPRLLLSDFLRHRSGLTATHVGCEQGVCGACNVLLDGRAVRACLLFAVQADGCELTTLEGLVATGATARLQEAFERHGALQCGFCTPGFLVSLAELLPELAGLDDARLRELLAGNICRCTGYGPIVAAAREAAG